MVGDGVGTVEEEPLLPAAIAGGELVSESSSESSLEKVILTGLGSVLIKSGASRERKGADFGPGEGNSDHSTKSTDRKSVV